MTISASLSGRLRNTSLPKSRALLPLFEAVVNAIQATDEEPLRGAKVPKIEITIIRGAQMPLLFDSGVQEPITGFTVRDNGIGFDDENMRSFETLDSEYKSDKGCRGIGRLLWLKAFEKVEVSSHYADSNGTLKDREFTFTEASDVAYEPVRDSEELRTGTEVRLIGFKPLYQQEAPKKALPIAKAILEHCLWYFVRPGCAPDITLTDGTEPVDLNSLYDEYMLDSSQTGEVAVKGHEFSITHLRLQTGSSASPVLNWCAAGRVVLTDNLTGKVPGLRGKLSDANGEFVYACFLESDFLNKSVRPERIAFDIPDVTDDALDSDEPSMTDIRTAALDEVKAHLHDSLAGVLAAGRARVNDFVDRKAPRYRPILRHIDDDKLAVDPAIADRELDLLLHRHLADIDADLLAQGQEVLDGQGMKDGEYSEKLKSYLAKVEDVKKSDLAAYVSRRRVILDLLANAVRADRDGRYAREDVIHNLIMPMRSTSDDASQEASNLWVIDEGLAFHNYLASDKPLRAMPITGSASAREPDILALQLNDQPLLVSEGSRLPLAAITVVEIKRPMRNDVGSGDDKDPVGQALDYLERVREGKVTTAAGRPVPGSEQIPGFCHVIADLTPTVHKRCRLIDLNLTPDGMGYFGYNKHYMAYIEVTSFDRLLNLAHQRNRAFFDKLGLPVG